MIHTKGFTEPVWIGGVLTVEYRCVTCNRFVAREDVSFLAWLVENSEAVYCDTCEPLPETIPLLLREYAACLLDHYSTRNDE